MTLKNILERITTSIAASKTKDAGLPNKRHTDHCIVTMPGRALELKDYDLLLSKYHKNCIETNMYCHRRLRQMEGLVRQMQDKEGGVKVRSQKLFLTSIPEAFMGFDLVEWLMDHLGVEESEALNLGNQLCKYGYIFPVGDMRNLIVRDDSTLYRFQGPYFWPWHRITDSVDYAIYLMKRSMRNRQRHGLEDYEIEALANLKKNLVQKWDNITFQAEEEIKSGKSYKKVDKIVRDSQERAYWRLYRPPPGAAHTMEQCPMPNTSKDGSRIILKKTVENYKREVDFLSNSLLRTRLRVSQAIDAMVVYVETFAEYDPSITPVQPSNPWVTDDSSYWQLNNPVVDCPTEKRVRRWAFSMEELVSDLTGIQEFTIYLRKEYSHENIRFWMAVNDLRRSSLSQIHRKVRKIFEEFLAPGAPCEINIDGKTMEKVHQEMKSPSRFTFDAAQEHVYTLLLKKDCYPRFIRSEHYKNLLATGIQPSQKKRFFGFGPAKKKISTSSAPNPAHLQQQPPQSIPSTSGHSSRRRGSDRSLSGSAHELAIAGVHTKVPHSHSQSNLSDIPYRAEVCEECTDIDAETTQTVKKPNVAAIASTSRSEDVCPWEAIAEPQSRKNSFQQDSYSSSSDVSAAIAEVPDRSRRAGGITQQSTFDGDHRSRANKKLAASVLEHRRASVSVPIRHTDIKPLASSFEECVPASVTAPVSPGISSDTDNKIEEFSSIKTFKLTKTCSVSGAIAPIISVSTAVDDAAPEEKDNVRKHDKIINSEEYEAEEMVEDEYEHKFQFEEVDMEKVEIEKKPGIEGMAVEQVENEAITEQPEIVKEVEVEKLLKIEPDMVKLHIEAKTNVEEPIISEENIKKQLIANKQVVEHLGNEEETYDTRENITQIPHVQEAEEKLRGKAVESPTITEKKELKVKKRHRERVVIVEELVVVKEYIIEKKNVVEVKEDIDNKEIIEKNDEVDEQQKEENERRLQAEVEQQQSKMKKDQKRAVDKKEEEPQASTSSYTGSAEAEGEASSNIPQESTSNDVCPWEDEETCKADVPFVKTYSTLGYL